MWISMWISMWITTIKKFIHILYTGYPQAYQQCKYLIIIKKHYLSTEICNPYDYYTYININNKGVKNLWITSLKPDNNLLLAKNTRAYNNRMA